MNVDVNGSSVSTRVDLAHTQATRIRIDLRQLLSLGHQAESDTTLVVVLDLLVKLLEVVLNAEFLFKVDGVLHGLVASLLFLGLQEFLDLGDDCGVQVKALGHLGGIVYRRGISTFGVVSNWLCSLGG